MDFLGAFLWEQVVPQSSPLGGVGGGFAVRRTRLNLAAYPNMAVAPGTWVPVTTVIRHSWLETGSHVTRCPDVRFRRFRIAAGIDTCPRSVTMVTIVFMSKTLNHTEYA